jgi:signal transduction histidine kinase/ligand-binding sensor domain-containing protein
LTNFREATNLKAILTIWFCSFCFHCLSQLPAFEKFNYRHGLSHQTIRCVFKDRQGFLWLGTDFGLNRYDGINFKKWFAIPGDSTALPHNIVNSIAQDKSGYIWVGTGNGIARMNPYTGVFDQFGPRQDIPRNVSNYDFNVFADADDKVWIGNEKGVFILNADRKLQKHLPLQLEPEGRQLNNYIYDFIQHGDTIYASSSYGLYAIHANNFGINHYLLPLHSSDDPNANALTRLNKGANGIIWCGSWFRGIVWFEHGKLRHRLTANKTETLPPIMDIEPVLENGKENLYLSSLNGLLQINSDSIRSGNPFHYRQYLPDKNNPDAISHSATSALYQDEWNNLWIGTSMGLNKIKIGAPLFQLVSYRSIVKNDYPPLDIVPVANNTYWIFAGPNNILYDRNTEKFSLQLQGIEKYSPRQLIKAGTDYYIASKSGLLYFNEKMQLQKLYDTINTPSLQLQHFNHAFYDGGNLWLGSFRKGVARFAITEKTFTHELNSGKMDISGHDVDCFFKDNLDRIWIGTAMGPIMYTGKDFSSLSLCSDPADKDCRYVQCFYQTKNNRLLIGTRDGLFEYDEINKRGNKIILTGQGISNCIYSILEDRNNDLWICTRNGLVRYNPVSKQTRLFDQKDGLPDNDLSNAFYKFSDSAFAIGVEDGLVIFNPLLAPVGNPLPAPVFASVNVDDKPVSFTGNNKTVAIAYNQSISFDFLSLNYSNTSQNQYQYIVEGLDKDWKKIGNDHRLRFSNLPAGSYTVKIKAANSDGEWNEEPSMFSFRVTPPFYKTCWFITACIAIIAATGYSFYRYRLQQAIRLERLRTRIATDLHDDIGATLSSISFYSEAVKQKAKDKLPEAEPILEKMGETSRNMVSNMSDIVWAINPQNDDMGKMLQRMQSYAAELCALRNKQLQVTIDEKSRLLKPALEQRRNIYLIFKEALNNALKYSDGPTISLRTRLKNHHFTLYLQDDGKGFDPLKENDGNGLKNIKTRATEIGASLTVITGIGQGTLVQLEVPV